MKKVGPILLRDIKGYFRPHNIIVNTSIRNNKQYLHFIKKKGTHLKSDLIDIVTNGIDAFWSGYVITENSPIEVTMHTNPMHIIVIADNPSLAFKVGLKYMKIIHKYDCKISRNILLAHLILEFKDGEDATAFRLEYG